jgi:hypothetical protein
MMKPVTDNFCTRHRALLLLLIGVCVFAGGCEHNPVTTWSAEAKSPDGKWVAMVRSEQWSGPGNAFDATTVSLNQAGGTKPPVEIMEFEHNSARMDLKMTWMSSTHLDIEYGSNAQVDFQAVKAFGEIEITVRDLSNGATSPLR